MKYRKKSTWAVTITIVIALVLTGCAATLGVPKSSDSSFNPEVSSSDFNEPSTMVKNGDSRQSAETAFLQIEPAILKVTQNATYFYSDGELSFTIGTDTAKFPSDDVSSLFIPKVNFMPSSIYVSQNKIAVVRMPNDDSIVITHSDDNGKTWQDSDYIHIKQIPDHSTAEATFWSWDKDKDDSMLSLYVDFPSKATGFLIIGSGTTMQTQHTRALYKTTDGGKSWNYLDSNITNPDIPITGICFMDEMTGFIVESHMNISGVEVRRTTDGGENWSASTVTLPRGLPDDGTGLLTAFAPYYASNQWVLPAFEEPDKLIYFTSQDQGATWDYNPSMDIGISQFLSSN